LVSSRDHSLKTLTQIVATKSKQQVTDVDAYCTEVTKVSIQSPHPMCGVQIITDGVQESSHLLTDKEQGMYNPYGSVRWKKKKKGPERERMEKGE